MSTLPLFGRAGAGADDGEPAEPTPLRVAELNRIVRSSLESTYRDVWVIGEVSEVTRATSGHIYFSLSDEREPAMLRVVMFRSDARRAKARIERGAVVRLRGQLTLFEGRGTFQMLARIALPAGAGDLHAEMERVRRKLEAEGLLDAARKRALPRVPRVVGVVTSARGAAMHDIVRVAASRCPVRIVVADCRVQGQDAPASIVAALRAIQRLPGLDVVIVGRGGGSQEDLWAFNHESVARAIAECPVPTVSAVGHEVDVTIADLVADVRAATPSNAAEIVVPDRRALGQEIAGWERRIERALEGWLERGRLSLERAVRRLPDPRHDLARAQKSIEGPVARARRFLARALTERRKALRVLAERLARSDPRARLTRGQKLRAALDARLEAAMRATLAACRDRATRARGRIEARREALVGRPRASFARSVARLEALSPLAVLSRGYAVALDAETGRAIVRAEDVPIGGALRVILHDGELDAEVKAVRRRGERRP